MLHIHTGTPIQQIFQNYRKEPHSNVCGHCSRIYMDWDKEEKNILQYYNDTYVFNYFKPKTTTLYDEYKRDCMFDIPQQHIEEVVYTYVSIRQKEHIDAIWECNKIFDKMVYGLYIGYYKNKDYDVLFNSLNDIVTKNIKSLSSHEKYKTYYLDDIYEDYENENEYEIENEETNTYLEELGKTMDKEMNYL